MMLSYLITGEIGSWALYVDAVPRARHTRLRSTACHLAVRLDAASAVRSSQLVTLWTVHRAEPFSRILHDALVRCLSMSDLRCEADRATREG